MPWRPVFGLARLLPGSEGRPDDLNAVAWAIAGVPELAAELGKSIEALDVNPLICGPDGAVAERPRSGDVPVRATGGRALQSWQGVGPFR